MKILILNGNPDPADGAFEGSVAALRAEYEAGGHTVETIALRELDIQYCLGCWSCWVKTPGQCAVRDGSEQVCRAYIGCDLAVFASPVIMGTTSALLKKAQDKLIPLLHPYIKIVGGECHHVSRYPQYPSIGVLLQRNGADDEDIGIITELFRRFAINFKSRLSFVRTTDGGVGEAAYEAACH